MPLRRVSGRDQRDVAQNEADQSEPMVENAQLGLRRRHQAEADGGAQTAGALVEFSR
jgi:hypothetical protein